MGSDDVSALLAGWREAAAGDWTPPAEERLRTAINIGGLTINDVRWIRHAADLIGAVVPLVAAAVAVLKEHQPVNRGEGLEPICSTCHRGFWPCPTVQAITAALTGEEASDG